MDGGEQQVLLDDCLAARRVALATSIDQGVLRCRLLNANAIPAKRNEDWVLPFDRRLEHGNIILHHSLQNLWREPVNKMLQLVEGRHICLRICNGRLCAHKKKDYL